MKKYIITMVLAVLTCAVSFGQEVTVLNNWENTYGSNLNIKEYNEASGYFTGTYVSHTRDSETCRVIGFLGEKSVDKKSIPISISINWKNFAKPSGRNDEKRTSTMTGQIYVDKLGKSIMEVYHNLQDPLPQIKKGPDFKDAGNYGQTLRFKPSGTAQENPPWNHAEIVKNSPYTGVWNVDNSGSNTQVNILAISEDNVVQATYTDSNNNRHILKGFIGDHTNDPSPKSISLAGLDQKNNKTLAVTGLIGYPTKATHNGSSIDEIDLSITSWMAPVKLLIYDEEHKVLLEKSHAKSYYKNVEKIKVNSGKRHEIYVQHDLSQMSWWDRFFYSWYRTWGYNDTYSVMGEDYLIIDGEITKQLTYKSFETQGATESSNTSNDELVFDALFLEGQSTYINTGKGGPAYLAHYSAVKMAGLYMTGPTENTSSIASFELDQQKNPLANYGASEWTVNIPIGTPKSEKNTLNIGFDTGGNFTWANSTQCQTMSCTDPIHNQFNPNTSSSFEWISKKRDTVSWGPWGKGVADSGRDIFNLFPGNNDTKIDFKLITYFPNNNQFKYFWDGALAMPSSNLTMKDGESHFLARLISMGKVMINDHFPVGIYYDNNSKTGKIQFGIEDDTKYDAESLVKMKFVAYPPYNYALKYLWTTSLESFNIVGLTPPQSNKPLKFFGFDSGSSAIKGDAKAMNKTFKRVNEMKAISGAYPELSIKMGKLGNTNETAEFKLTNEEYVQLIGRGDKEGTYVPQIQPLIGVDGLLVQGSTIMSSLYTVYDYKTRINPNIMDIELYPHEIRAYNLKNGPKIIQPAKSFFSKGKTLQSKGISVYPNPMQDNLTINLSSETKENIYIVLTDLAGRTIYKTSRKARKGANLFNLKNSIQDPSSIEQQIVIISIRNESGTIQFKEKLLLK